MGADRSEPEISLSVADPESDDALWAMGEYFAELDRRFPSGFDAGDTLTADAAELREPLGVFVVARAAEAVAGCGGLWQLTLGVGEIKRMWVAPEFRGQGLGGSLLGALESHARQRNFHRVRLDTNGELGVAIAMYSKAGYRQIERYNDNPFAEHWFEKLLVG